VLFTLLLILLTSLSGEYSFLFAVVTYLLLRICFLPAKGLRQVLKFSLGAAAISVILLLPALSYGGVYSVTMIPIKMFITVTAAGVLSRTSRWDGIIASMRWLHIPNIFIFILDITIKYIGMLGAFTLDMMYALKLRSIGKNKSKYASLSGVAGTMFLASREMAEEMHAAMVSRGFTGEYRSAGRLELAWADAGYMLISAALLFLFFMTRG
jgi:cobalt/nickel transport system permease protein